MNRKELHVTWAGVNVRHTPDFVIDRPSGSGDYLFLCYVTPVTLRDATGTRRREAGGCIIYQPGSYQWYGGVTAPFCHHWLHFHGTKVRAFLRGCGLEFDRMFHPRDLSMMVPLISQIHQELQLMGPRYERIIACQFQELFLKLGRQQAARSDGPRLHLADRLREVRSRVHGKLGHRWTVAEMAGLAGLSASRFSVLYRRCLNTSPLEDLLSARLQESCRLLTNTSLSVSEVAARSGFESISYFSRLFRRRIGCPPRDYYRTRIAGGGRRPRPE